MKKRIFSYRKLAVLGAVIAIALALVQSGSHQSTASTSRVDQLNLGSETQLLQSYLNDLVTYNKECAQLSKKATLSNTEIDGVQRRADSLKQRLPGAQGAIAAIVTKLKGAHKWETINADVLAATTDPRQRTFIQELDIKASLEDASSSLSSHTGDISNPVDILRRKVARSDAANDGRAAFVKASYEALAPAKYVSLGCEIGKAVLNGIVAAGGRPNNSTLDVVSCACNPGKGIGIATGASCASLGFGT